MMNKLSLKVFYTIFILLEISIFSFVLIFNIQTYRQEKEKIDNDLVVADRSEPKHQDSKFLDATIYTVLINEKNEIKEVINNSNSNIDKNKIIDVASKILKQNNKRRYVGNLYFEKYSYNYQKDGNLIILDNSAAHKRIVKSLNLSLIVFLLLTILIYLCSKKITKWITEPVKESFEKQKTFVADASHELKTPLSVIIASSELLLEEQDNKWAETIKTESLRMNSLITDLLDLATTENVEVAKEVKDLSKIVELSVLTFEAKAYEKNVKIKYNIESNIMMNVNENNIRELIEILLDNALKHTFTNKQIIVNLKNNQNNIELSVINYGDGIPKGEEEKIFERFYRVDKSRNRNENRYGLGLAIARNIVLNHNGKIMASSKNNLTEFKVLFKK